MIRAVIFDLDGVLIDSERAYFKLNKEFLESNGFKPTDAQIHDFVGTSMDGTYAKAFAFFPKGTMTMGRLRDMYQQYANEHPLNFPDILMEDAHETLTKLKGEDLKLALASSSPLDYIEQVLKTCKLEGYFDKVISGELFKKNKPDPEVYDKAIEALGVLPKECLVVEDSKIGIQAGKAAKAKVVGLNSFAVQDRSGADLQIDKLSELPELVTQLNKLQTPLRLNVQDKELILVPVAHVSKYSAYLAKQTIEEEDPDSICIELDADRLKSLEDKNSWEKTDIVKIIKDHKTGYFLVSLLLSSYQKRIAKNLDSNSGAEMLVGIAEAKKRKIPLVLADRSIQTTFTRIWRKMKFKDKFSLLVSAISSLFEEEDLSEEDIAKLEQKDELTAALQELQDKFPQISEVLVTERDKYLAAKIKNAPGKKVVAILGAAHLIGIQKWIKEDYSLAELDELPPKGKLGKNILWTLSAVLILLVILTFTKNQGLAVESILNWIIWHGGLSALGCLLCLAHPLTILVGFLAAPLSALNPLLASGWFAGLTQATIRKPTVADFERVPQDCSSFKGFMTNRVTKILMIVILSNIGSTLATFIGGVDIVQKFLEVFG